MRAEWSEGAGNWLQVGKPWQHGLPVQRKPGGYGGEHALSRAHLGRVALGRARRRHRGRWAQGKETFGRPGPYGRRLVRGSIHFVFGASFRWLSRRTLPKSTHGIASLEIKD
jgi:hypothetical protein